MHFEYHPFFTLTRILPGPAPRTPAGPRILDFPSHLLDFVSRLAPIVQCVVDCRPPRARGEFDTLLPEANPILPSNPARLFPLWNTDLPPVIRRTVKKVAIRLAVLLLFPAVWAHDVATTKLTWTREISRLVTQRCVGCHQPGGPAPFSLQTYAEARPWAVAIKEEVLQRRMPPWPAAKGFGDFANDISLPQEEINRLAEWAEGGAPEGDPEWLRPAFAVPPWRPAPIPAGTPAAIPRALATSTTILAIRSAGTGKIWAQRPDGAVIPLAWLTGTGKPQWLVYRQPIRLPAGTRIHGPSLTAITR